MDRLPQETRDQILQYLDRHHLAIMRLVHRSFVNHGAKLLFQQVNCKTTNWEHIDLLTQRPDLRPLVSQLKLINDFLARKHLEKTTGDLAAFPNLSHVEFTSSPRHHTSFPPHIEQNHTRNLQSLLASPAFKVANITSLKATGLERYSFGHKQVIVTARGITLRRLTRLHLQFSDISSQYIINDNSGQRPRFAAPVAPNTAPAPAPAPVPVPAAPQVVARPSLGLFLAQASSLRSLYLDFETVSKKTNRYQPMISFLTESCNYWPQLKDLKLRGIYVIQFELDRFLVRHSKTLKNLHLCNITYGKGPVPFQRLSMFEMMGRLRDYLQLDTCIFSGHFTDPYLGQVCFYPHRLVDDSLFAEEEARRLNLHMLDGDSCTAKECDGSCPMVRAQKWITHRSDVLPWALHNASQGGIRFIDAITECREDSCGWDKYPENCKVPVD